MAAVVLSLSVGLAGAAEEDLTIAAVLPLTGQFGPAGQLGAAGQKDCTAIINEEGGINGKRLRYVVYDGQYKLDVAMAAFDSWRMKTLWSLSLRAPHRPRRSRR